MAREITKVTMLQTTKGSPDGFTIIRYDKGSTYELPLHLSKAFLASGWAEPFVEAKMQAPAYENKAEVIEAPVLVSPPVELEEKPIKGKGKK